MLVGLGLAGCSGGWSWTTSDADPSDDASRPHVLLVSVDTLRGDRLGYAGHDDAKTPRLDALAAEGTWFSEAITPMARTTPGLASMMSGRWPHHHGSREVHETVDPTTPWLPEVLQSHGYATYGVSTNPSAGGEEGLDRGFDTFDMVDPGPHRASRRITARVLRDLDGMTEEDPLFMWVHYIDPHFPYRVPGSRRVRSPCDRLARVLPKGKRTSNYGGISERALPDCWEKYDEEVAAVDAAVGTLVDGVRAARDDRPWLIVFTSDHGESFGEHDLWYQHGPTVHESALNVPLMFVGDGVEAGGFDDRPATLQDVAPTMLDLLGLPEDAMGAHDGVSLVPRLSAATRDDAAVPPAFAEGAGAQVRTYLHHVYSGRVDRRQCLNDPPFALCWGPEADDPVGLYDGSKEPTRTEDVSAQHPKVRARLEAARETLGAHNTRSHSVRIGRWKLIDEVRITGEHHRWVVDVDADPAELDDRSDDPEAPTQALTAALDAWMADIPPYASQRLGEGSEAMLEALGYVE